MSFISVEDFEKQKNETKDKRFKHTLGVLEVKLRSAIIDIDGYYVIEEGNKMNFIYLDYFAIAPTELEEFLPLIEKKGFYVKVIDKYVGASYNKMRFFIKPDPLMKDNVMKTVYSTKSNDCGGKDAYYTRIFDHKESDSLKTSIDIITKNNETLNEIIKELNDKPPSIFESIIKFFKIWGNNNKF